MRREEIMESWGKRPDFRLEALEESSGNDLFDKEIIERWEQIRPKIKDFAEVYDADMRRENQDYLESRGIEFELKSREATRLEFSVMEGIGSRNWFGQNCEVVPANRVDDVANGVDVIVCFTREGKPSLKLALDITTSEDVSVLRDKIFASADALAEGGMGKVKYFHLEGEENEPKGGIRLPRAVIGTNSEQANLLFEEYVAALKDRSRMGNINNSEVQIELIKQIQRQLTYFSEVACEKLLSYSERRKGGQAIHKELASVLEAIRDKNLSEELDSSEFQDFLRLLKDKRVEIKNLDKVLSNNLLAHTDVIEVLEEVKQEKSSSGIRPRGAQNDTEKVLELEGINKTSLRTA